MFLQDGIAPVIIIIIIICLLENETLFHCPGHIMVHDLNSFDTIVLSILWIEFPNPVSQRCHPGSPPYMNRTFCVWRYLDIQRKNKFRSSFYWIRMNFENGAPTYKKKLKLIWVLEIQVTSSVNCIVIHRN
jgi:hypothetical protein